MKIIKTLVSAPAFWIGLCFAVLGYLQVIAPKSKPLTEAQLKEHEEIMVNFAL